MSRSYYERELNRLVDEIYEEACNVRGWKWQKLADKAGLSYQTIRRLGNRETRLPQLRTVILLVKAVGMSIQLIPKRAQRNAA